MVTWPAYRHSLRRRRNMESSQLRELRRMYVRTLLFAVVEKMRKDLTTTLHSSPDLSAATETSVSCPRCRGRKVFMQSPVLTPPCSPCMQRMSSVLQGALEAGLQQSSLEVTKMEPETLLAFFAPYSGRFTPS